MTLSVTSPLTKGKQVKDAQGRLAKNQYGDFLRGPIDGIFGEGTGRACRRAKYALGYPTKELKPVYGAFLENLLSGTKLPLTYKRRRGKRLRAAQNQPLRVKALARAKGYVGQKESPAGSNRIDFASNWYGVIGPWCAMAVTRWYVDAGSKGFAKGSRYAYVPYIAADARAGRNGLSVTTAPLPGDIVCFDWDGGVADHVGLFDAWVKRGFEFRTVEGNTGVGNDSNGGECMQRTRQVSQVECFVRVGR